MYIIIRAYSGEDKRIQRTGQFWHYGIYFVPAEIEAEVRANLDKYNHATEIPDNLAQADRYLDADLDHALAIKPLPNGTISPKYEDLISASNIHDENKVFKKQIYYLTEQNKQDARDLLKIVLSSHIRKHTKQGHEQHAKNLRHDINAETDLINLKKIMSIYFDVDMHWPRKELDAQRVHQVDYKYHPDNKLADNV